MPFVNTATKNISHEIKCLRRLQLMSDTYIHIYIYIFTYRFIYICIFKYICINEYPFNSPHNVWLCAFTHIILELHNEECVSAEINTQLITTRPRCPLYIGMT